MTRVLVALLLLTGCAHRTPVVSPVAHGAGYGDVITSALQRLTKCDEEHSLYTYPSSGGYAFTCECRDSSTLYVDCEPATAEQSARLHNVLNEWETK